MGQDADALIVGAGAAGEAQRLAQQQQRVAQRRTTVQADPAQTERVAPSVDCPPVRRERVGKPGGARQGDFAVAEIIPFVSVGVGEETDACAEHSLEVCLAAGNLFAGFLIGAGRQDGMMARVGADLHAGTRSERRQFGTGEHQPRRWRGRAGRFHGCDRQLAVGAG